MGDTREAIARGDEALALAERLQGPESAGVAIALQRTAGFRHGIGDYEGARTRIERAMAIWRKVGGSGQHVGEALSELAALSESEGRLSRRPRPRRRGARRARGGGHRRPHQEHRAGNARAHPHVAADATARRVRPSRTPVGSTNRATMASGAGLLAQSLLALALVDQRLGRLDDAKASAMRAIELFMPRITDRITPTLPRPAAATRRSSPSRARRSRPGPSSRRPSGWRSRTCGSSAARCRSGRRCATRVSAPPGSASR